MASEDDRISNINLVCEVKKYEVIYDCTRDDYCNRQLLETAWAEIGNKLGMTGADARNRWANLRTVFVRRRSRMPKLGSTKPYYLDKYMRFLIPNLKLKAKSTASNLPTIPKNQQPEEVSFHSEPSVEKQQADGDVGEDTGETTGLEADMNHGEENFVPPLKQLSKTKLFLKSANSEDDVDKAIMEYFVAKKNKIEIDCDPIHARKMFLLSLLPEVNDLPEYQFKTFKRKVLALLDEMEESRSVPPTNILTQFLD